ncbi:hypothetical protein Hanom_Chr14g01254571 [Helianthus anomalus]
MHTLQETTFRLNKNKPTHFLTLQQKSLNFNILISQKIPHFRLNQSTYFNVLISNV